MVDYVKLQATALKLITSFGRDWTLRRLTKGTYNPTTNTRTTDATTNYTIKAVLINYKNYQIDGTNIIHGDKLLLVASSGLAITPMVSDLILDGSEQYKIINIKQIKPASTVLYYELQLRP